MRYKEILGSFDCQHHKTSVGTANVSKRDNSVDALIFRISVVMSKKRNVGSLHQMFFTFVYGVLVMVDHDTGRQIWLLYLPTQIRGERVTCHWSKLHDALAIGRTKLHDALGQQQLELSTHT